MITIKTVFMIIANLMNIVNSKSGSEDAHFLNKMACFLMMIHIQRGKMQPGQGRKSYSAAAKPLTLQKIYAILNKNHTDWS